MRITATKVKSRDIKPGELFSTDGQFYWDHFDPDSVGQSVFIRTEKPVSKGNDNEDIYRIEIVK